MKVISHTDLPSLMEKSRKASSGLAELYARIPQAECKRRSLCCRMLPDAALLEVLSVLDRLSILPAGRRMPIIKRVIRYFLMNPIEMTNCPFLQDRECLVYAHRFFGCRAYGLWSYAYYEDLAVRDREAKLTLQQQWEQLGVSLPVEVIHFHQPYCRDLQIVGDSAFDDTALEAILDDIYGLSRRHFPEHSAFQDGYFSDMSFLIAAATLGIVEAVRLKYENVKAILNTGNTDLMDDALSGISDIFAA